MCHRVNDLLAGILIGLSDPGNEVELRGEFQRPATLVLVVAFQVGGGSLQGVEDIVIVFAAELGVIEEAGEEFAEDSGGVLIESPEPINKPVAMQVIAQCVGVTVEEDVLGAALW